MKNTLQKRSATFRPFLEKSARNSAADIFRRPLLCFAAEISASWQHWLEEDKHILLSEKTEENSVARS
jgi:hypothetical protein